MKNDQMCFKLCTEEKEGKRKYTKKKDERCNLDRKKMVYVKKRSFFELQFRMTFEMCHLASLEACDDVTKGVRL